MSRVSADAERRLLFAIALAGPRLGCDRQIQGPARLARHKVGELIEAAEAFRHLSNDLIVYVQNYGIAGGFNSEHRIGKQITCNPADDVFSPKSAVSALPMPTILKLSGSVVGEHDMLLVFITDDARLRIG